MHLAGWVHRPAGGQRRSDALTGIIGARRACTVSLISPLSMPCRYTEVMPRSLLSHRSDTPPTSRPAIEAASTQ
jgi:hypothetical protein